MTGELARRKQVGELVGRLADDSLDRAERGRLLTRLTGLLAGGAKAAGAGAALSGRWLADVVTDVAPHIAVRDLATLQAHSGGLPRDALADSLVRTASLATAGVGAAGGGLAAVQHAAPPTLLLAPLQLAAETVAVVAIELKLVAELHVVHGRAPVGTQAEVAAAYLSAWGRRRGLDLSDETPSLGLVLGTAARLQLRKRIVRRFGRNITTMAPFLAGAVAGAELNRRQTRALGVALLDDLRG